MIAPVALILDFPVLAIAACALGLFIVAGFFGGLAPSLVLLVTLGELSVGVMFLMSPMQEFRGTMRLGIGGLLGLVWLGIAIDRGLDARSRRRSQGLKEALEDMPLAKLTSSLADIDLIEDEPRAADHRPAHARTG